MCEMYFIFMCVFMCVFVCISKFSKTHMIYKITECARLSIYCDFTVTGCPQNWVRCVLNVVLVMTKANNNIFNLGICQCECFFNTAKAQKNQENFFFVK